MSKALSFAAVALVASAFLAGSEVGPQAPVTSEQGKDNSMQEAIWSLELAYFDSLYRAEYEKVLALVHPGFIGWPDGLAQPLDREGSAAYMRKLVTRPAPCKVRIERAGVQIPGSVALTQYTLHADCTGSDGTVTTRSSAVCHTWIKDGSSWKLLGGMSRDL